MADGAQIYESGDVVANTYRIVSLLAKGGIGEVYRAVHEVLETEHALKVLQPHFADDPKISELFKRESAALRTIRHEAIVAEDGTIVDAQGRLCLVMEFLDGPSLQKVLKAQPLTSAQVRRLAALLSDGLATVHDHGIVHRDLSPDNVILQNGDLERPKIIDFGIAKFTDATKGTVIGQDFAGKYSFASPEAAGMFGGEVDRRSDIYSLALVLAAAAIGKPLDMGRSLSEIHQRRQDVPDLSAVPDDLRDLLVKMLQPDPADRPQSLRELDWADPDAAPTVVTPIPPSPPQSLRRSRIKAPLMAGGLSLLVLVAGAVTWFYSARAPEVPPLTEPEVAEAPAPVKEQGPSAAEAPAAPKPDEADVEVPPDPVDEDGGDLPVSSEAPEAAETDTAGETAAAESSPEVIEPDPAPETVDEAPEAETPPDALQPDAPPEVVEADRPEAPEQVAAVEPRVRDAAELKADVDRALSELPCATLRADIVAGDQLLVTGYLPGAGFEEPLRQRLAAIDGLSRVTLQTKARTAHFCDLISQLAGLGPVQVIEEDSPALAVNHHDGVYRSGDVLIVTAQMANRDEGFLYVDYIDESGQVFHLLPSQFYPDNRTSKMRPISLGRTPEDAGPSDLVITIDEKGLGTAMIVALETPGPLFADLRAQGEPIGTYAADLLREISSRFQGDDGARDVIAHYRFLETIVGN